MIDFGNDLEYYKIVSIQTISGGTKNERE